MAVSRLCQAFSLIPYSRPDVMDTESRNKFKRPKNPYATAGLFSRLTFWWMRSLFRQGLQRQLVESDIYECLDEHRSTQLIQHFEQVWQEEQHLTNQPCLYRVILQIYAQSFLWIGFGQNLLDLLIKILLPQCLGGLIIYFSPDEHNLSINDAILYAGTIVIGNALVAITFHGKMTYGNILEQLIRHTCMSAIYKKMLRLSKSMSVDGLNGQAITLMSNDANRTFLTLSFIDVLYKGPLMTIVLGYFIYLEIGWYVLVGIGFLLLLLQAIINLSKLTAKIRAQTAKESGQRIQYIHEILQAIEIIKMYAWEKPFAAKVDEIRKKELKSIRSSLYIRLMYFLSRVFANISIFLSLIAYVYFGNAFSARKVYITTAYMQFIFTWMIYYWSFTIEFNIALWVSLKRIGEFLLLPESKPDVEFLEKKLSAKIREKRVVKNSSETELPRIHLLKASASWVCKEDGKDVCSALNSSTGISGINLNIIDKNTCVIIGTVGSGKSTLLQVMLGELELDSGSVNITGTLSYSPQEPWLFSGSVRQNIVFVEQFDEERYLEVVRVCALERDFELLPYGDKTIVGERGSTLSGGQRARVSLARAIYKTADIYLIDDPLSAVDSRVGKHIFENSITGFLKDKICVLVTHQLQFLNSIEHIVMMDAGQIYAQGNWSELRSSVNHPLLNGFKGTTINEEENGMKTTKSISPNESRKSDVQIGNKEMPCVELKGIRLYTQYFDAVNNKYLLSLVVGMLVICQSVIAYMDIYISKWSTWEDSIRRAQDYLSITNTTSSLSQNVQDERGQHLVIYISGTVIVLITVLLRNISILEMCLMASRNLHTRMFRGITHACMSFFKANPSGRILTRFSKDIDIIDSYMSFSMFELLTFSAELMTMLYLISNWSSWMMIPNILLLLMFVLLYRIYIRSAVPYRNFEAITRSDIFVHTNETFKGLNTIRAYNAEQIVADKLDAHLDYNISVSVMFLNITRAYVLWVELACCMYMALIVCIYLAIGNDTVGSQIGLAISQMLAMTTVSQFLLRQQTEVAAQMLNVQRVLEYANIESETTLSDVGKPTDTWPTQGSIHIKKLYMSYTKSGSDVLHDINLHIRHQEKIGIVGRTGAGKSSIVQALFRLAYNRGSIVIDGIDISTLGLPYLRSKISIIPQNPILFSGSIRHNLDPFDEVKDDVIWEALDMVALKSVVASMSGGLEAQLTDGGSNFSMGQRQLMCLARAMLKQNRILILDEATSNVDPETDRLIQKNIKDRFGHFTVLTIAHRLHTVMDSDRVMVVDAGRVLEFDQPAVLLRNSESQLSEMVRQTGSETEQVLRKLAEQVRSLCM